MPRLSRIKQFLHSQMDEKSNSGGFVLNGAKVSLICLMMESNQLIHLFVVDGGVISNAPEESRSV